MREEQGKDKLLALLGAGECDSSANKQGGDTHVRGDLRLHVWGMSRRFMAALGNSLLILFHTAFLGGGDLMTPGRSTLCN